MSINLFTGVVALSTSMENGEAVDTVLKHESNGYLDQNSNGSSLLESLFQRRVEFHLARKPFKGFSNSSDFQLETLNPSSENQKQGSNMVHSNGSEQKKSEGSDFLDIGLDPELNFGFTLRKIVSFLAVIYINSSNFSV